MSNYKLVNNQIEEVEDDEIFGVEDFDWDDWDEIEEVEEIE
jgi:hypothetical protein